MKKLSSLVKRRRKRRSLDLSVAGRYVFALVVLLCFVAVSSQNNVLYLITSFVLAALIVSGFTSDYALYSVRVRHIPGDAEAQGECTDSWVIENKGWLPIFGMTVGEVRGRKRLAHVDVTWLSARSSVRLSSKAKFTNRGRVERDGIYVRTLAPFGFVGKTLFIDHPRSRIIEPLARLNQKTQVNLIDANKTRGGLEFEGEIRDGTWADDARDLITSQLARNPDAPRFRKRNTAREGQLDAELDVTESKIDAELFEVELSHLAYLFKNRGLAQVTFNQKNQGSQKPARSAIDLALIQNPFGAPK